MKRDLSLVGPEVGTADPEVPTLVLHRAASGYVELHRAQGGLSQESYQWGTMSVASLDWSYESRWLKKNLIQKVWLKKLKIFEFQSLSPPTA